MASLLFVRVCVCVCVLHILTGWLKLCVAVAVVSSMEETRRECEDPHRSALFFEGTTEQQKQQQKDLLLS